MSNRKTIIAAVVFAAIGQAALATTGATSKSEESFVIHPTARSQSSSLTREQVRAEFAAARQADAATDIWTAADGGNPARLAGGNAAASLSPSASEQPGPRARATEQWPPRAYRLLWQRRLSFTAWFLSSESGSSAAWSLVYTVSSHIAAASTGRFRRIGRRAGLSGARLAYARPRVRPLHAVLPASRLQRLRFNKRVQWDFGACEQPLLLPGRATSWDRKTCIGLDNAHPNTCLRPPPF